MERLTGKIIMVAGAGGIGGGLARRYAAEGAKVAVADIKRAAAESVVSEINEAGGQAIAIEFDGADEGSVNTAITTCLETYGGIDGMHANFALMADCDPGQGILELPLEVFDETQRINARGFYLCTRAVLPALLERGGGSIVYTSSAAACCSGEAFVAYAMSKSAGHALMRHVASRFGPMGVRANTIAPAMTVHPALEEVLPQEFIDMAKAGACIKSRVGRPEDVAAMGALLMSDEGSYITGQLISVDGGTTMRA